MRKVVFRGKLVDTQEWTFGSLVNCHNGRMGIVSMTKYCEENGIEALIDEVLPETVGQFTGLTDKNGKDVWEGDIVMLEYNDEDYPSPTFPFVIAFSDGAFCIAEDKETPWAPAYDQGIMELIGNLWDNPELLKGGEK